MTEVAERHAERLGHDFEKASRTRRALVIHHKVDGAAVVGERDDLAVLSADVDDRARAWHAKVRAARVACYFAYVFIGQRARHASIARGHCICAIFEFCARSLHDRVHY